MSIARTPRLIPCLVTLLGVLGALKLGHVALGVTDAQAQGPAVSASQPKAPDTPPQEAPASDAPLSYPQIAPSEVERRILKKLASRRSALEALERELSLRESLLTAAEQKMADRAAALDRERIRIDDMRAAHDVAAAEDIGILVSAYEKMKPRNAAEIFNALDQEIMLAVAENMRTQSLAGILANMSPERARVLTELLAARNSVSLDRTTATPQDAAP